MFGYVIPNRDELKIREDRIYRAYYCGLCHEIGRQVGAGRLALSYDMTFLTILLDSLYDGERYVGKRRCALHPVKKHPVVESEASTYAAQMNVLLAYDNLLDKWHDERNIGGFLGSLMLKARRKKIAMKYPRQSKAIADYMEALHRAEEEKSADMDLAAGLTGQMLAEIYDWKQDEYSRDLRGLGFFIGKFVYLADAYDDYEKDLKKGSYNPLVEYEKTHKDTDIKTYGRTLLEMMAGEAARFFERLPLVENMAILRNTLYSGVFVKINKEKKEALSGESRKDD